MFRSRVPVISLCAVLALSACARQAPASNAPAPTAVAQAPTTSLPTLPTAGLPGIDPTPEVNRDDPTFTVERGDVLEELILNGRVSLVQMSAGFNEAGTVSSVKVERGDQVEKGQVLAELSISDLENQLNQARADYTQSTVAIQRATQAGQIEVRRAELALEAAQNGLKEAKQAARPDQITAAQAAVQQAQASLATVRNNASATKNAALEEMSTAALELEGAQARYNAALAEFERSDKSPDDRTTFEAAREELRLAEEKVNKARITYETALGNEVAAVQTAEASVKNAQAQLDKLLAGPDPFVVAEAERKVRLAQVDVQDARLKLQPDPALARAVALAESQIQGIQEQITSRRLYAPIGGEVLAVEIAPGMTVAAASPVVILGAADQREIIAESDAESVSTRDSARLVVGQQVELEFARHPGQTLTGTITRVPRRLSDTLDTSGGDSGYAISYDAGALAMDVGDLVEVRALIGRSDNTLWLPPEAIRTSRDRPFAIVRDSSGDRRVEILLGLSSPTRVEILRGLNEGDVVVGQATTR